MRNLDEKELSLTNFLDNKRYAINVDLTRSMENKSSRPITAISKTKNETMFKRNIEAPINDHLLVRPNTAKKHIESFQVLFKIDIFNHLDRNLMIIVFSENLNQISNLIQFHIEIQKYRLKV